MGRKAFANRITPEQFLREKTAFYAKLIDDMPTRTKSQRERKAAAEKHLSHVNDPGRFGRIEELLHTPDNSNKIAVAEQNLIDNFILYDNGDGAYSWRAIENKHDGGRLEETFDRMAKAKKHGRTYNPYFVYNMHVCNSGTTWQLRILEPIVIKWDVFYRVLRECNAIKKIGGKNPGIGIQAVSKKLYLALLQYPIPHNKNSVYRDSDFEGLETLEWWNRKAKLEDLV